MKLLDRSGGNTKLAKTDKQAGVAYHFAGLSMYPTKELCPGSKAAGCMSDCLKEAGLAAVYGSVNAARKLKTQFFLEDRAGFMQQYRRELFNYDKWCTKKGVVGVVRGNVLQDIRWEDEEIPQEFHRLQFYDYTKQADRFYRDLPTNYQLMFSYSGKSTYKNQVKSFLESGSDAAIAVVFRDKNFPTTFLGRPVINGDESDWVNVQQRNVVVGLVAKGPAKTNSNGFVVDTNVIPTFNI